MLRAADTVGVFQVESRAQMATLPRMKPERFYDLVVEVAIIRPGPIVGKMVHPYLERRTGREPVGVSAPLARADPGAHARRAALPGAAPAHGDDRGRLHRRRGRGAAPGHGLQALGGAHEGDRGAAARGDGRARDHRARPRTRSCARSPRSRSTASPSRTRRASRSSPTPAPTSRRHHPAAFVCALLNNQPMGFYHPSTLVKDAQRHGVRFRPIDVTRSGAPCTLEEGAVRLGLGYVRGLRAEAAERIEAERARAAVRVAAGLRRPRGAAPRRAAQRWPRWAR